MNTTFLSFVWQSQKKATCSGSWYQAPGGTYDGTRLYNYQRYIITVEP